MILIMIGADTHEGCGAVSQPGGSVVILGLELIDSPRIFSVE